MPRKLILSLLLVPAVAATAQVRYQVGGLVPDSVSTVYMRNFDNGQVDTAEVAGGKFCFTGEAERPAFGMVMMGRADNIPVWIDGEPATLDFTRHELDGSETNRELNRWEQRLKPYYDITRRLNEEQALYRPKGQTPPDSVLRRWQALSTQLREGFPAILKECCEANKTTVVPAIYLGLFANMLDTEDLLAVTGDDRAYMDVPILERLKEHVQGLRRQAVGAMFTDIELNDTTGTARKLSDYLGKGNYVLLDFWASWCGPCRAEMPAVKAAYERFAPKGFQIVGLSLDMDKAAWTAGIEQLGLTWPQLSDLNGWQSLSSQTYGVSSIPHTLLVGPDGKIVASGLRGEELAEKLEEIYK